MKIKISEVQIIPVRPKDGLIAFATCILCDCIYLGNIAVYTSPQNADGYRLVFPTRKLTNGKHIRIFHPITDEARKKILQAIVENMGSLS